MKFLFKALAWFYFLIIESECARILAFFPTPSISHQIVFHALMKDLAARSHQLMILTTDLIEIYNENVTQIDLHSSYEILKKLNFVKLKEAKTSEFGYLEVLATAFIEAQDQHFDHPKVKKLINRTDNLEFDLLIVEHLGYGDATLAFSEVYKCPTIGISSIDIMNLNHEQMGNGASATIDPDENVFASSSDGFNFLDRWRNLKYYLISKLFCRPRYQKSVQNLIQKHFPNVISTIEELTDRIQLLMINTSPVLGHVRPLLPNTIQLGFMHIEPPKPLKGELKEVLDNSRHGVIYMSLGSNVKSEHLSSDMLNIFMRTFGSLSFDVLWKFETDNMTNKPDNVVISKWLPQSDLLAHPKVKAFITQGGQQSMEEAIDRMVPMIVIPFFGDQDSNAQRVERKGIGKQLNFHAITESKLTNAINEIMDPKYKENIKNLRALVYDQPMTSREKAVWWTEYVIRHKGTKHLEYPGRNVPFYQKFGLDFIAILVLLIFAAFKLSLLMIRNFGSYGKTKKE